MYKEGLRRTGLIKIMMKAITLIFVTLMLFGCSSSSKQSVDTLSLPYYKDDFNCGQTLALIRNVITESSQRSKLSTANVMIGLGVGVVALPVIVAGGLVHSAKSKKRAKNIELYLDNLVTNFEQKGCEAPSDWDRNAESFRRAVLLESDDQSDTKTFVASLETLAFPNRCTNAVDDVKRVYEIGISDLNPNEYLRFTTVGKKAINRKFKASHLLFGEVKLPMMSISSRKGGWKRGLWVERIETNEKFQLNYLRPNPSCNSKATMTVLYRNLWAVVSKVE